jgi:hypothetical protein
MSSSEALQRAGAQDYADRVGQTSPNLPRGSAFVGERLVKGSHIVAAETWVDTRLGKGTLKQLTENAGQNWRIILPVAWYEIDVLHDALEEVSRRVDLSVEDITTQLARLNAESDLRSIYKVFLRVAQPQRVLSMTPRLWTTYVRFGSATAITNEKGLYVGQGDGFDQRLLGWGCGCWRGFIPATIEVAGGRVMDARIINRWRQNDGTHSVQFQVVYE